MKKPHFVYLFFSFLIAGFVQVPSMSWAQETVAPSGPRQGFLPQRRENRQERRQDFRENRRRGHTKVRPKALKQRRENRQDRRQDFRSNRQGGDQRKGGNRGGGGRGRR